MFVAKVLAHDPREVNLILSSHMAESSFHGPVHQSFTIIVADVKMMVFTRTSGWLQDHKHLKQPHSSLIEASQHHSGQEGQIALKRPHLGSRKCLCVIMQGSFGENGNLLIC